MTLPRDKPLDYQTEEEFYGIGCLETRIKIICPWPLLPSCNPQCSQFVKTRGACSTTNLAVANLYLFYNFSHGSNGATLWIQDIPHWKYSKNPSFSAALASSPPVSTRYPKVQRHLLLQVFNPFLPRRPRESDSLHMGSTCMLFIRISSSVKLGKKLLFKALGGSKHY